MDQLASELVGGSGKRVFLLNPRGFCAGVVRAVDIVRIALETYGPPIYVRKEIVHNQHVVEQLRNDGAIFVEEVSEAPDGARLVFSAHGVSPAVRQEAKKRGVQVIDATCPLVTKVHLEATRFANNGYTIVLIGHQDHDEVVGTRGEAPDATVVVSTEADVEGLAIPDSNKVAYLTQTTLSLDETAGVIDRLSAYLIDDAGEVDPAWMEGVERVAVTAGASAPDHLVQELIVALKQFGFHDLETVTVKEEDVHFALPPELQRAATKLTTIAGT